MQKSNFITIQLVKGGATFWKENVTLTCPESAGVTWYKEKATTSETTENPSDQFTFIYERQVQYRCQYTKDESTVNYYFYVKGKGK